jgi:putative PIN family toxin of toxin-antitoxin system
LSVRIVLDTNVLVSGLLSPQGASAQALGLLLEGEIGLCVDARIVHEYREVISRPEWKFSPDDALIVLDALLTDAQMAIPSPLNLTLPDQDDVMFVETAIAAEADAIVTGNKKHFPQKVIKMPILSPAELIQDFKRKK